MRLVNTYEVFGEEFDEIEKYSKAVEVYLKCWTDSVLFDPINDATI